MNTDWTEMKWSELISKQVNLMSTYLNVLILFLLKRILDTMKNQLLEALLNPLINSYSEGIEFE